MLLTIQLQKNAAIAAGSFFVGSAFCLLVAVSCLCRSGTNQENGESVKMSQINSKLNSSFSFLAVACGSLLGCAICFEFE